MDIKALFKLSYGVFVLGTKHNGIMNACVTNTCIQVASNPTRVALSVLNNNYTCDLLKESRKFALSVLDQSVEFQTIKHFGMQSGRDVNKFEKVVPTLDDQGMPYIDFQSCAVISGHVVETMDLGSHTLFIAEIDDAKVLSDKAPLTYSDYQDHVKPKPVVQETKEITGWRCKICGYVYEGKDIPKDFICPLCGHDVSDFEPIYK